MEPIASKAAIAHFNSTLLPAYNKLSQHHLVTSATYSSYLLECFHYISQADTFYNQLPNFNSCSNQLKQIHTATWDSIQTIAACYLQSTIIFEPSIVLKRKLPHRIATTLREIDYKLLEQATFTRKYGTCNWMQRRIVDAVSKPILTLLGCSIALSFLAFWFNAPANFITIIVNMVILLLGRSLLSNYHLKLDQICIQPSLPKITSSIRTIMNLKDTGFTSTIHTKNE